MKLKLWYESNTFFLMNKLKNTIQTNAPETFPKNYLKPPFSVDPIYYTNVWDHPKQQLNHFNDYIPAVYEPECSDGGGGDIGLN